MDVVLIVETLTDTTVRGCDDGNWNPGGRTLKILLNFEVLKINDKFTFTLKILRFAMWLQGMGLFDMSSFAVQLFVSKLASYTMRYDIF